MEVGILQNATTIYIAFASTLSVPNLRPQTVGVGPVSGVGLAAACCRRGDARRRSASAVVRGPSLPPRALGLAPGECREKLRDFRTRSSPVPHSQYPSVVRRSSRSLYRQAPRGPEGWHSFVSLRRTSPLDLFALGLRSDLSASESMCFVLCLSICSCSGSGPLCPRQHRCASSFASRSVRAQGSV